MQFIAYQASPHDFLSAIFGILGKFCIDIGAKIFCRIFFTVEKNRSKKKSEIFGRKIYFVEADFLALADDIAKCSV